MVRGFVFRVMNPLKFWGLGGVVHCLGNKRRCLGNGRVGLLRITGVVYIAPFPDQIEGANEGANLQTEEQRSRC